MVLCIGRSRIDSVRPNSRQVAVNGEVAAVRARDRCYDPFSRTPKLAVDHHQHQYHHEERQSVSLRMYALVPFS